MTTFKPLYIFLTPELETITWVHSRECAKTVVENYSKYKADTLLFTVCNKRQAELYIMWVDLTWKVTDNAFANRVPVREATVEGLYTDYLKVW